MKMIPAVYPIVSMSVHGQIHRAAYQTDCSEVVELREAGKHAGPISFGLAEVVRHKDEEDDARDDCDRCL